MLTARHQFIEGVTHTRVSPWNRRVAYSTGKQRASSVIGIKRLYTVPFYQCVSARGEYGVFITAHAHELETILESFLSSKKTLYIINSCQIYIRSRYALHDLIKNSSSQSELFLAHQAPPNPASFIIMPKMSEPLASLQRNLSVSYSCTEKRASFVQFVWPLKR